MNNQIKYNCVFGGGGIRGLCYIGALKALKEHNIEISSTAGSSVGAVFAALIAVGYNEDEIKALFLDFNFNMFRDININLFSADISVSKGEIFLQWLRTKLQEKAFPDNPNKKVTFKDLKNNLNILTIDLNTNTPFIFSKETTPEEEVAVAVRASAGLPGLMKAIIKEDLLLVDGDLIKSWPAWKIYKELNTPQYRLLEFRLEGSRDGSDIKNPIHYLSSIINTIWYFSTENVFNLYNRNDRYDYIVIDTKDTILFDFSLDRNKKEELIDKGYKAAKEYLSITLPEKKQKILCIYNKILDNFTKLKKLISENKAKDSINLTNEIASNMVEETKYIDFSIYEGIMKLKELMISNKKKQFIFVEKFDNEKYITEQCTYILMLIKERIEDLNTYIKNFSNKS